MINEVEAKRIRARMYRGSASNAEKKEYAEWLTRPKKKPGRKPGVSQVPAATPSPPSEGQGAGFDPPTSVGAAANPNPGPPPIGDLPPHAEEPAPKVEKVPLIVGEKARQVADVFIKVMQTCNAYNATHGGWGIPDQGGEQLWGVLHKSASRVIQRYLPVDQLESEEFDNVLVVGASSAIIVQTGYLYATNREIAQPVANGAAPPPPPPRKGEARPVGGLIR